MDSPGNRHYEAGLDGLRAFAILFVVFYHFGFNWARGGFLGVDIFFVLSGYLITSKILSARESFEVKAFWKGRLIRLLPAAYFMIIVIFLWTVLFDQGLLTNLSGDTLSSVSLTTNWWFIFHKLSYFDSFGSPSPLKHIWYLAVQEQFYFLWPLILITILKITKKIKNLSIIICIGAVLSATLMGILYTPAADPSRVYYGTDTRVFELLMGCFLAAFLAESGSHIKEFSAKHKSLLNLASIMAFSIFIAGAVFIDEYNDFLYRGGLFLFSLNTALLIGCVRRPEGILGSVLSWKPLRWLGTRSYGIYLWHYPVMVLTTPVYEIGNPSYLRVLFQLAVTCIIAEFSYRFIELPIRKLGLKGYFSHLSANFSRGRLLNLAKKLGLVLSVLVTISLIIGITGVIKTNSNPERAEAYTSTTSTSQISEDEAIKTNLQENDMSVPVENSKQGPGEPGEGDSDKQAPVVSKENNGEAYNEILFIGDSILLDIAKKINEKFDNITIDGKVGRQMSEAAALASKYSSFNASGKAVIIELGTNGYFTNGQIDGLLDSFSKAHIFLVNVRVPRSWESRVNDALREKAGERENVTLIDWYSLASKYPGYFSRDGVHLTSEGVEALSGLISDNL